MEKEEEERREEGRAECWRKEGDGRGLMCRISISQKWPFRFARVQIRGQMRNMLLFFFWGGGGGGDGRVANICVPGCLYYSLYKGP